MVGERQSARADCRATMDEDANIAATNPNPTSPAKETEIQLQELNGTGKHAATAHSQPDSTSATDPPEPDKVYYFGCACGIHSGSKCLRMQNFTRSFFVSL